MSDNRILALSGHTNEDLINEINRRAAKYKADDDPLKGKSVYRQSYAKGQIANPADVLFMADILLSGGTVELKAEGAMANGASYFECKVYYKHPNQQKNERESDKEK